MSGEGSGRRLSRRDFLLASGAGLLGAGAGGLAGGLGGEVLRRLPGPAGSQGPAASLLQDLGSRVGLSGATGTNVVLVVLDSLRKDAVTALGGEFGRSFETSPTPNLDAFVRESLSFTRAVPEAMPTIPARRAIYTGLRTFPFEGYEPPKGENVLLQGWQPIPEEQWSVAEVLASAGYFTMKVTDNCHEAKPSYNFGRGFAVHDLIRGQEKDLYRPPWECPEERLASTLLSGNRRSVEGKMRQYFANTRERRGEEDYFAPRVFSRAAGWVRGLAETDDPFFLVVDSFDPHEPWDPPEEYVRLFGESYADYSRPEPYVPVYGDAGYLEEGDLARMKVLYAAELAMVDRWFGHLLDALADGGLLENTAVLLVSDHGVAFGEHGTVGKPHYALWPEVTDVPFVVRDPRGRRAGETHPYLASTHDVAPTVLGLAGVLAPHELDGEDLSPIFEGREPAPRPYLAGGLHDHVFARDEDYALISSERGPSSPGAFTRLYNVREDPGQHDDLSSKEPEVARRMYREYVLGDAPADEPGRPSG